MADKPQLVSVEWNDAWADDSNFASVHGVSQTHKPMRITTIGWVLMENEEGLSLANEQSTDDSGTVYRGRTFIPKGMIVAVTPFKMSVSKKTSSKGKSNEISHPLTGTPTLTT